jgi:cytochrome c oxidase subunit 2
LEYLCSIVLLVLCAVLFWWGAVLFLEGNTPPKDAMEIYVTGKQWMWKAQHPQGKREINELHVPLGQSVKLTMTSEDVIHDFFIPAFRAKNDVLPGRYTSIWFKPTMLGKYRLYCAEYCGTEHSFMGGWVYVVPQAEYERWQRGASAVEESPVVAGAKLFTQLGCATCHNADSGARGPNLNGLVGSQVELQDGTTVTADDSYVRESIVNSQAKIVAGFDPLMPIFQGLLSEDQLAQIVAYIKSLSKTEGTGK